MKYSSQQRQRGKLFKCTIKEKPGDRDGVQYLTTAVNIKETNI